MIGKGAKHELTKEVPNNASLPIHDSRLSLAELSVVWLRLSVSTSTGNSGHG